MPVRAIIAIVAALLIAAQVVRNAMVGSLAPVNPTAAAKAWSGHPASQISLGMTEIARSTRARRPVPQWAFDDIASAATKSPLAADPFLVRGVQAGLTGNSALAERAFEAAQWRDPRSLPAAYFLADRYFRSGNVTGGLREVGALARLSPDGGTAAVPYLAQYAANPANWPALRSLFATSPQLEHPLLIALASDLKTVPAALALGNPRETGNQPWLGEVVNSLIKAGDYPQALSVWRRMAGAGVKSAALLRDADFRDSASPPPFNWLLTSSTVGLAERQRGRLHILFYGDEDGTLASQLLLLPPGSYRVSFQLGGEASRAHALTWAIWCDKAPQALSAATLDVAAARGWQFNIPAGCQAQWLRLSGVSTDVPQQVDVSIGGLTLVKEPPGA